MRLHSSHLWCDQRFTIASHFPTDRLARRVLCDSSMTNLKLVADTTPSPTYRPLRQGAAPALVVRRRTPTPAPAPVRSEAPAPVQSEAPAPVQSEAPVSRPFSRWRAFGGAIVGASVPASVFTVSHTTVPEWAFSSVVLWVAVVGGLVFSAQSVYQYGCKLFRDRATGTERKLKAACYCALAETIMTFAPGYLLPLSLCMLAILIAVNAIENGRNAGA